MITKFNLFENYNDLEIQVFDLNLSTICEFEKQDNNFRGFVYFLKDEDEIDDFIDYINLDIIKSYNIQNTFEPKELYNMLNEWLDIYGNNITIVGWEAFCKKYNFLPDYVDDSHTSRIQELKEEYELLIHERNKKSKIEDFNL